MAGVSTTPHQTLHALPLAHMLRCVPLQPLKSRGLTTAARSVGRGGCPWPTAPNPPRVSNIKCPLLPPRSPPAPRRVAPLKSDALPRGGGKQGTTHAGSQHTSGHTRSKPHYGRAAISSIHTSVPPARQSQGGLRPPSTPYSLQDRPETTRATIMPHDRRPLLEPHPRPHKSYRLIA